MIPIEECIVGEIYYGNLINYPQEVYYFQYLGNGKWTVGHTENIINFGNHPYAPNTNNVNVHYHVDNNNIQSNLHNTLNHLIDEYEESLPIKKKSIKKTKYKVINASRTDNTKAVFREF